jgi:hypothetical protein
LDHIARLPVVGRGLEAGGDDHAMEVFVEDESVQREPPIHKACSRSPLMSVVMIATQKRAAMMRFARGFMI